MIDDSTRRRGSGGAPFHGWRYAGIGAMMNLMAAGLYGRGFSVYFLPLARDLGLSHTGTSLIFGFSTLEGGLQAPITGYFIDKYGPKVMMLIGVILAGTGFLILPMAQDFVSFVLIYVGVISLGINSGFHNAAGAIVNRWFMRRRGLAFGIISVGIALGGGIMTPIVEFVVLEWGWRYAASLSGMMILAVGLPLAVLVRNSPEDVGQIPDGERYRRRVRRASDALASREFTFGQATRTGAYWLLALGITLRIAAQAGILVHIVPMLVWKGMPESVGGIAIATISFSAVGTRLFMGWLGDKTSKRLLVVFGMIVGAGGALFLLLAPGQIWVVVAFGLMFAVTDGAAGLTWAMIGDYFGQGSYATLRGTITFCVSLGSLATPVIVGIIFDTTSGYSLALMLMIGVYAATAAVFTVIRRPKPITNAAGARPLGPRSRI